MRSEIKEYQAVEEAAMKFVKSVAEGDSKYAKELFIDEAVLFGYLDGELEHGSIEQFYHNVAAGRNTCCCPCTGARMGQPYRLYRCAAPAEDERRVEMCGKSL